MEAYKFASVAGMMAMGASVFVEHSLPCLVQVGQAPQPGQAQPQNPAHADPARPGSAQPGRALGTDPLRTGAQPEAAPMVALFALRDPAMERRVTELRDELQKIEKQMQESNQRLIRQLAQVRLLEGERKVDALSDVVHAMLEEHVEMESYLRRMREALTGRGTPGSALGTGEPADDSHDDDLDQMDDGSEPDDGHDIAPAMPPQPGGVSPR